MNYRRSKHTSCVLSNGNVLVVGGLGDCGSLNIPEVYDASSDTWTIGPKMAQDRYYRTVDYLPDGFGTIVVIGGTSDSSCLESTEIYRS